MDDSSSASTRESALIDAFADLADTLVDDYDMVELLHRLVERCVDLLGLAAAGLMLADQRGGIQVVAASSEHVRVLELIELQADQGPCLDAFHTGEPVLVDDLTAQTERWPLFAPQATQAGFASVHAIPMRLRHEVIGALNMFGEQPGVLPAPDLKVAQSLAHTATIGILHERTVRNHEVLTEQLQTALNNRVTIEQAKGMIAHAGHLPMDQAFTVLRTYSRYHQLRLSEVAARLTTSDLRVSTVLAHRPYRGRTP
ncbi:GAF and ANTAR domain-containing protein [Luteipulveratus mongoliensis]|uniref:Transcriptional regulator n=1 Tax=Luteipulveratus mongoliensis TaxID=571913 RepID=A0A0K1JMB8_9MICO|nr:GAF and ANTAR domain-containing protein [Luteipulveratus mongoliensis]AKU17864.1 transcriptional regulator [Luteipulveratus mongoliensis]